MDFSVLMSVYKNDNPEHYKIALNSVTKYQTLKPTQVVIVFDGPVADEIDSITNAISLKNKDIEFTVIKLEKNGGLAAALNIGLKHCKYEYVARMDSDDVAVKRRFEKQFTYLEKNPDVDILGGIILEFEDDPKITGCARMVGFTHKEIVHMAKRRTPFNHMTVVYKKSKVLAVGGYAEDFGKLEDYKLWVDMIASGCKTANLKDFLIHMRVGNGLISRRSNKREIQDWDNLQKYLLDAHIINHIESILNRIYIRVFTYMPPIMKKIAYKTILRKS